MDRFIFDPFADLAEVEDAPSDASSHTAADDDSDSDPDADDSSASSTAGHSSPSDASASATTTTDSSASPPTSDSSYRPHPREQATASAAPQFKTLAERGGFLDPDHHRFHRLLRLQHHLRIHDVAFTALSSRRRHAAGAAAAAYHGPASPDSDQQLPPDRLLPVDQAAIPCLKTWRAFRRRNVASTGISAHCPLIEIDRRRCPGYKGGADTVTAYRVVSAFTRLPEHLLNLLFSLRRSGQVTPAAIMADGIGDLAPGMPDRGKCFSLYLKALTVTSPQSARWLVPILVSLGSDSTHSLDPLYREIGLADMIQEIINTAFGPRPGVALVICAIGDFPAIYSMVDLRAPNRQYPTTPGRVPAWQAPICHLCGIPPSALYHARRARLWGILHSFNRDSPPPAIASRVGIPPWVIFYELVHMVRVQGLSLLADIGVFYLRLSRELHPVAAYIYGIFALRLWDPFLVTAAARSKTRRSRKPFYNVDPAPFWHWLLSAERQRELLNMLMSADVPLDTPYIDGGSTPARLWCEWLRFVDAAIRGILEQALTTGMFVDDVWRVMLSISRPMPDGIACADPAGHSSFYAPIVAYGPASHTGFCSLWRCIEWASEAAPHWRDKRDLTFLKFMSGICVEAAMKVKRTLYTGMGIGTTRKRDRALHLLTRLVERFALRLTAPDDGETSDNDEDEGSGSADPSAAGAGGSAGGVHGRVVASLEDVANRAYRSVPMSQMVPLDVIPDRYRAPARYDIEAASQFDG